MRIRPLVIQVPHLPKLPINVVELPRMDSVVPAEGKLTALSFVTRILHVPAVRRGLHSILAELATAPFCVA
jgi:hypothetical protein